MLWQCRRQCAQSAAIVTKGAKTCVVHAGLFHAGYPDRPVHNRQAHYQELRSRESKSREEYAIAAEKQRDRKAERTRGFVVCAVILAMAAYVGMLTEDGSRRGPGGGGGPPARPPAPH